MLPGLARVGGLVDSVALVDRPAADLVARSHIHDVRVGRRDLYGADAGDLFDGVENGIPRFPGAGGFPNASGGNAHVKHARLADGAADGGDASPSEGADVSPLEPLQELGIEAFSASNR